VRFQIAVFLTTNLTGCLLDAGCCSAGVLVLNGNRLFGRELKAVSGLCTYDQLEAGFFCRIGGGFYNAAVHTAFKSRGKRTVAQTDKLIPIGCIRRSFRQGKAELVILRPANLICTTDVNGRNILFCSFVIAEFTLLPILPVFTLPLVGVSVVHGYDNPCFIACLVGHNNRLLTACGRENKLTVFIKDDFRTVHLHCADIFFVNGNSLCRAIGFAGFNAGDNGACSVKHNTVCVNVGNVSAGIGQFCINNILVIGIDTERCGICRKGHSRKFRFGKRLFAQQVFNCHRLAAVVSGRNSYRLRILKEQTEGDGVEERLPVVFGNLDFACRCCNITPLSRDRQILRRHGCRECFIPAVELIALSCQGRSGNRCAVILRYGNIRFAVFGLDCDGILIDFPIRPIFLVARFGVADCRNRRAGQIFVVIPALEGVPGARHICRECCTHAVGVFGDIAVVDRAAVCVQGYGIGRGCPLHRQFRHISRNAVAGFVGFAIAVKPHEVAACISGRAGQTAGHGSGKCAAVFHDDLNSLGAAAQLAAVQVKGNGLHPVRAQCVRVQDFKDGAETEVDVPKRGRGVIPGAGRVVPTVRPERLGGRRSILSPRIHFIPVLDISAVLVQYPVPFII